MTSLSAIPEDSDAPSLCDIDTPLCSAPDNPDGVATPRLPRLPGLPLAARLPINRCNLPAAILGGLTFQRAPTGLFIDGVADLHRPLFELLDDIDDAPERAQRFAGYMTAHFSLEHPEAAGHTSDQPKQRSRASYLRVVRGWAFDPDGREAAALKGWVESRFGLLPRFHGEPLREPGSPAWQRYVEMRAAALYGTNALEAQLDLLYAYCQYEFRRCTPTLIHLTLFRGINRLDHHEVLAAGGTRQIVLFNNIASFTSSRERAGEFGDHILAVAVPVAKVFFHCALLPGVLKGEDEHLVIGGVHEVDIGLL